MNLKSLVEQTRNCRPATYDHLWWWVYRFTGIKMPREAICRGHSAPFDLFARQVIERPSVSLWCGPRGSGKSFMSAIDTHVTSRFNPRHGTQILGGSLAQSEQTYQAIDDAVIQGFGDFGSDRDSIFSFHKKGVRYKNGSSVSILAASSHQVRGPHVPSLKLDEVDEIADDIRESAMGMAMEVRGQRSSVLMTSTWHKVGGPMAQLMERGYAGAFPVNTWCVFEVLERCPDERSGPNLEACPQCPIMKWCHQDRDQHPSRLPKAKRSTGHYTIDSLIQKAQVVSERVFESDYLCLGPKASGVWFTAFDQTKHVTPAACYDRTAPIHIAIDCGVYTGAVFMNVRKDSMGKCVSVNVFADYLGYDKSARENALAIKRIAEETCKLPIGAMRVSMDPAGDSKNAVGPVVKGEYESVGCRGRSDIESWPTMGAHRPKADSLTYIDALLYSAVGNARLKIHPSCRHMIQAFQTYRRKSHKGTFLDEPERECHPQEDLIDPLAGGLLLEFPEGNTNQFTGRTGSASRFLG